MRARSDDLPALGSPTSAASARSFSRSSSQASSPGSPVSANRGAWRVGVAKRRLPRPPAPPCATSARAPGAARSTTRRPSSSKTCVPTGTRSSTSSPSAPCCCRPRPGAPWPAWNHFSRAKRERSRRSGSATTATSPPGPRSPPSAPPWGTCSPGGKLTPPWPPRPAWTRIFARSWNIGSERTVEVHGVRARHCRGQRARSRDGLRTPAHRGHRVLREADGGGRRSVASGCGRTARSGRRPRRRPAASARARRGYSATLTKRRSPLRRNSTRPSRSAKIVSSRPRPAPGPGRNRVPRWRTMIDPARTCWPAKTFTPSIFGFESRPLRDEPRPFLCAILLLRLLRRGRLARRRLRLRRGLRLRLRGRLRLLLLGLLRRRLLRADRLDLDLRQGRPEAGVPPVARLWPVLADPDLVAAHVADDPRRHEAGLRAQVGLAVAADEQDVRRERLAFGGAEPVDEQPLSLVDAVLLAADGDDRVAVHVTKSGPTARERGKCTYLDPDSTSSSHSDIGTYSHSPLLEASASAAAGVFFLRPRPPREPRRVRFFGFGVSAPSSDAGASTSSSAPSSGSGTWIVGSGAASGSSASGATPSVAASAVGFF